MSVTRREVAEHAGVSESTVSYVINNGPRPVSEATRARVLVAIKELGYQPNAIAQSLRRQQTTVVGLIVPDTANPFYGEIARVIENTCELLGYAVMMGNSGGQHNRVRNYLEQLTLNRVAGIMYIPTGEEQTTSPALKLLVQTQIPSVVIDYFTEMLPCAAADQPQMGYLATRHLIELGHRRIGYVARNVQDILHQSRYHGYQRALQEAEIASDPALVVSVGELPEDGVAAGHQLLGLAEPPTAVFAHNDMNAIGVIRAARDRGLFVPRDLSVVGCDNISLSAFIDPPLTTVAFDVEDLGERAVKQLIAQIENGSGNQKNRSEVAAPQQEILYSHLIVRDSTAPQR